MLNIFQVGIAETSENRLAVGFDSRRLHTDSSVKRPGVAASVTTPGLALAAVLLLGGCGDAGKLALGLVGLGAAVAIAAGLVLLGMGVAVIALRAIGMLCCWAGRKLIDTLSSGGGR